MAPVGPGAEQTQTVGAVFVEFLCVSLYVAVPVLLALLALLVHMMEYRLRWEQNIDCTSTREFTPMQRRHSEGEVTHAQVETDRLQ